MLESLGFGLGVSLGRCFSVTFPKVWEKSVPPRAPMDLDVENENMKVMMANTAKVPNAKMIRRGGNRSDSGWPQRVCCTGIVTTRTDERSDVVRCRLNHIGLTRSDLAYVKALNPATSQDRIQHNSHIPVRRAGLINGMKGW